MRFIRKIHVLKATIQRKQEIAYADRELALILKLISLKTSNASHKR